MRWPKDITSAGRFMNDLALALAMIRHLAGLGHPVIGDRVFGMGEEDGMDLHFMAYLLASHSAVNGSRAQLRDD
jgi:hypothetical protein